MGTLRLCSAQKSAMVRPLSGCSVRKSRMAVGVWRMVVALVRAKLRCYFCAGKMGLLGCLRYFGW